MIGLKWFYKIKCFILFIECKCTWFNWKKNLCLGLFNMLSIYYSVDVYLFQLFSALLSLDILQVFQSSVIMITEQTCYPISGSLPKSTVSSIVLFIF